MFELLFNPLLHAPLKKVHAGAVSELLKSLGVPVPEPFVSMLLGQVTEERSIMEVINANGGLAKVVSAVSVLKTRPVSSVSIEDVKTVLGKVATLDDAHVLGLERILTAVHERAGEGETLGSFLASGKAKEFALEIASGKKLEPRALRCDYCGHTEIVIVPEDADMPKVARCPSCHRLKIFNLNMEEEA